MNVAPQQKRRVHVHDDGYTIPDLPIGTKRDQIRVYVETKKYGARHRDPQRRRLRTVGAHFVEINPENGDMRAQLPPYKEWISYEKWLQRLEVLLKAKPER